MAGAYDTLYKWARRTTTSFAEFALLGSSPEEIQPGDETTILRLKHWPDLPSRHRTAAVYRAFSVMSNRPVNRSWFLRQSRLKACEVDGLIDGLIAQGVVEKVDISGFAGKKVSQG